MKTLLSTPLGLFLACVGLAVVIGLAVLIRRAPRPATVVWLAVLVFVPVWLGPTVGVYLYPASCTGILLLIALAPRWISLFGIGDLLVAFMVGLCVAAKFLGGQSSFSAVLTMLLQWILMYLLGRSLPSRVGLDWMYRAVAIVFSAAAALGLAEFFLGWNPFVQWSSGNGLYQVWSPLQLRGGLVRVEGAFGHSIAFGASMALAVPVVLRAVPWRLRTRMLLTGVIIASTIVTFSRVAMLCAVLGLLFSALFGRGRLPLAFRAGVFPVVGLLTLAVMPFISSVFSAAGSEATNSADYRGSLLGLVPHMATIGYSPLASRSAGGELYFGQFQSIDSQLILTGLTYGWLPLIFALLGLLIAVAAMLCRVATAPTIALVAQIPALATVALITQYASVLWLFVGLAVYSQIAERGQPERTDNAASRRESVAATSSRRLRRPRSGVEMSGQHQTAPA
ncbi:hypothetical protein [Nakamurella aerolata]|uniref:O-antigen ligase-like membrane protein n=1 Tax=Nakamurella aerolata TaxID=1656892 RepID=A0A849A722_9ACTN|nr:hypothetical protein [Nakamurella aerolata]NNG35837.1 hypothetical protein [Nakamurella aerolata]